jgi:murein DD-endopeptidase MepM/ murein hydrolase activator NlpD
LARPLPAVLPRWQPWPLGIRVRHEGDGVIGRSAGSSVRPLERSAIRAGRLRPERRIEIRVPVGTFAFASLVLASSRRRRFLAVCALFAGAAATAHIGLRDLGYQRQIRARHIEILHTRAANAALHAYAGRLRQQLARTARDLAAARARIAAHQTEADAVRVSLSAARQQLQHLQSAPASAAASAANLTPQAAPAQQQAAQIARLTTALTAAERQRQAVAAQRADLTHQLAQVESKLASTAGRTDRLRFALARLKAKLGVPGTQPAIALAGVRIALADAPGVLGEIERKLAAAGIDVERFLAGFGIQQGVGGPFIPASDAPNPAQLAVRQAAVMTLMKTLPLAAPLLHYRETSPFGIRHNPFTGRGWEFHPGVDLAAPFGTPIYATAPGIVTYAGWETGYGKLVRIDNGHGLSTGYGHLHAFTVVVGEKVAAGTQIGYEGSTGRSTGPHVIYEVRLNGHPVNPGPFLALGREIAPTAVTASAAR